MEDSVPRGEDHVEESERHDIRKFSREDRHGWVYKLGPLLPWLLCHRQSSESQKDSSMSVGWGVTGDGFRKFEFFYPDWRELDSK